MATVRWLGSRSYVTQIDTITVSNATAATIYTVTHSGTGDYVTYTAVSGETVDTVATGIANAIAAGKGGFADVQSAVASGSGGTLVITGPADSSPYTLTCVTSPTTRASIASTVAVKGPHDAADVLNYSSGALPSASDTLVFENGSVGPRDNLTALAGIALTKIIRRATFTGVIGRPETNERGYPEYRTLNLDIDAATWEIEARGDDSPGQFRIRSVSASACAITINGSGANPPQLGSEPFYINGTVSTSTLAIVGSGAFICPVVSNTSVFTSISTYNATLRVMPSATVTTLKLTNSIGDIGCAVTTLTLDRGVQARLYGSGAYTTINCEEGKLYYQSSGTITTLNIGSGGSFDCTLAAAAFTVTTCNFRGDGCELLDPTRRINTGTNYVLSGTDLSKTRVDFGTGGTFAFSA